MRPKYQLRLESPSATATYVVSALMPTLTVLFGEDATFAFRTFPSRYDKRHVLTYIDINKPGEESADA